MGRNNNRSKGRANGRTRSNGKRQGGRATEDIINVKGQLVLPTLSGSSSGNFLTMKLAPDTMGDRPLQFANLFSRYRFTSVVLHYVPITNTNTVGALAFGFVDDTSVVDINSPLYAAVTAMRRSIQSQSYQKCSLRWKPLDPLKWYYTSLESATSPQDTRFTTQLSLFVSGTNFVTTSTVLGTIIVEYNIQFAGAMPVETAT